MRSTRTHVVVASAFLVVAFGYDLITPRGHTDWVFYLLAVLLTMRVPGRWPILVIAAGASAFTILGLVYSPPSQSFWVSAASRFMALVLIWTAVVVALRWRRADEKLRRLEKAVESSREIVFMTNREGVITFVNSAFTTAYGYSAQEVVGKTTPRILKSGLTPPETYKAFWEALLAKRQAGGEFVNQSKGGRLLNIEASSSAILDERGEITGFLAVQHDITARKQAEEALRNLEERFSLAFNASPEPTTISTLSDGVYIDVNSAFLRVTGHKREEVMGQSALTLKFWALAEQREEFVERLRHGPVSDFEAIFLTKSGDERHGLIAGQIIDVEGNKCLLAVTKDITERKRAEEELKRLNRAYRTISQCNQVLVRASTETELLQSVCEILVRDGVYLLAWVGYAERDEAKRVRPVASAGLDSGYLGSAKITWAEDERGRGPTGRAIRTGEAQIARDIQNDPQFAPWREEAERQGFASNIALPLIVEGQPLGALMLYSPVANAFDEREVDLLRELANDVAFGIQALRGLAARERAEEALRASEQRFRDFIAHSTDGVWCLELKHPIPVGLPADEAVERLLRFGVMTECNQAMARIQGAARAEEIIGKRLKDMISRDDRERIESFRSAARAGYPARTVQLETVTLTGEPITLLRTEVPILENGNLVRVWGMTRDITELRRAEVALRASQERFSVMFEKSPVAVALATYPEARFVDVNEAFVKQFGYSKEETLGKTSLELGLNPDSEVRARGLDEVRERGSIRGWEVELRTKSGELRSVINNVDIVDVSGRKYLLTMTQDISERKRAESALRESEDRYRDLVEHSTDLICTHDLDGRLLSVNAEPARNLGYTQEEMLSRNMRDFLPPELRGEFDAYLDRIVRQGEDKGLLRVRAKDGRDKIWEYHNTLRTEGLARPIVRGLARDITDQLASEEALKKTREQFLQAQKMEAMGRLAGGIAHDFNNLLTVINGYSELMLESVPAESPNRIALEEIKRAGERASTMTRQLLAFSRKQVVQPHILNLNEVVEGAQKMLQRLVGEDIRFVEKLAKDLGQIRADAGQIEQVMMNLAVNARDAMPKGGKLTIETSNAEVDEGLVRGHPWMRQGRYAVLTLSDTGCGMDAGTMAHGFEPFFTTKGQGKGTGLGLSTVYGIVKQSGGYVNVYSEPGRGTTFRIYFPRVDEPVAPVLEKEAPTDSRAGAETILLVEDELAVRALAQEVMEAKGYSVLVASCAEEALAIFNRHRGAIQLLLTDVIMPGMNGRELADRVKSLHGDVKVLFVSGYTAEAIAQHGILEEGVAFLSKPFSPPDLLRKVRHTLDS